LYDLQEAVPPQVECRTAPHTLYLCFICALLCYGHQHFCACMVMFFYFIFSWGRLNSRLPIHITISSSSYYPNNWISFVLIFGVRRRIRAEVRTAQVRNRFPLSLKGVLLRLVDGGYASAGTVPRNKTPFSDSGKTISDLRCSDFRCLRIRGCYRFRTYDPIVFSAVGVFGNASKVCLRASFWFSDIRPSCIFGCWRFRACEQSAFSGVVFVFGHTSNLRFRMLAFSNMRAKCVFERHFYFRTYAQLAFWAVGVIGHASKVCFRALLAFLDDERDASTGQLTVAHWQRCLWNESCLGASFACCKVT